mmetsp:Transcript_28/g.97  ORF Transcript_28/g.97 Transcript_28/m.97 type:complete len:275 (+) Transcript_28:471-1295(+)
MVAAEDDRDVGKVCLVRRSAAHDAANNFCRQAVAVSRVHEAAHDRRVGDGFVVLSVDADQGVRVKHVVVRERLRRRGGRKIVVSHSVRLVHGVAGPRDDATFHGHAVVVVRHGHGDLGANHVRTVPPAENPTEGAIVAILGAAKDLAANAPAGAVLKEGANIPVRAKDVVVAVGRVPADAPKEGHVVSSNHVHRPATTARVDSTNVPKVSVNVHRDVRIFTVEEDTSVRLRLHRNGRASGTGQRGRRHDHGVSAHVRTVHQAQHRSGRGNIPKV